MRLFLVALVACGGVTRPPQPPAATPGICGPEYVEHAPALPGGGSIETFASQRVDSVELVGAPRAVHGELAATLAVKANQPLDTKAVRRDLLALEKLEIADDITVTARPLGDRVAIQYQLEPRGRLARVAIHGLEHRALRELRGLAGGLDNPRRVERVTAHVVDQLRRDGYLDATLRSIYVARGEVCSAGSLGRRYVIDRIAITGNTAMPEAELHRRLVRRLAVNRVGGPYHEELLDDALVAVKDELHDRGYLQSTIQRPYVTIDRDRARVTIRIAITEGDRYRLGAVHWRGLPIEPAARSLLALPAGTFYSGRTLRHAVARLRTWADARDYGIAVDSELHDTRVDLVVEVAKGHNTFAR